MLIAKIIEGLGEKFPRWKDGVESKGRRVNIGKTSLDKQVPYYNITFIKSPYSALL